MDNNSFNFYDTIAAIATPLGYGGIGIIRISGPNALSILKKIFLPASSSQNFNFQSHRLFYGWIFDQENILDEVMVTFMQKPHTFTAEDVVEINLHGGSLIIQTVLELILKNDARLANPGEFTQRAFLNGRIDLTKAEAINDLIHAKTQQGLHQAINQLKGQLYDKIQQLKNIIMEILALINAEIEFSEENITFINQHEILSKLQKVKEDLLQLIKNANTGRILREGYHVVLLGEPNAGKSSIMNLLLQEQRSIVTEIPGTTRDFIQESFNLNGIPILLTDTAGLHLTDDPVEKEGIKRTLSILKQADLILWIIDSSKQNFDFNFPIDIKSAPAIQIVFNKSDLVNHKLSQLPESFCNIPQVSTNIFNENDLQILQQIIFNSAIGQNEMPTEQILITNVRQKNIISETLKLIKQTIFSLSENEYGEEILAVDLTNILDLLGQIVGETTPDDMLNHIFSNFCIGK